jgi:hypothetical protein
MSDWKDFGFQIILAIIGSSLFGIVSTNLYSIFIQPNFDFIITGSSHIQNTLHTSVTGSSHIQNTSQYRIIIINKGLTAATDARLTLFFNGNLTKHNILAFENISKEPVNTSKSLSSIVINVKRFSPNAIVLVNANVTFENQQPIYYISVAHAQTTVSSTNMSKEQQISTFAVPISNNIGLKISLLIIASILSFISFITIAILRKKKARPDLISNIIRDIIVIRNELQNDENSKRIFLFKTWASNDEVTKRCIIHNYQDYQLIDEFYCTISERDLILSQKNILNSLAIEYNKQSLNVVKMVTNDIVWENYYLRHNESNKNFNIIFTILCIFLGSFIVNIIVNTMTNILIQLNSRQLDSNIIFSIQTALRGLTMFLIIIGIYRFRASFFKIYKITDNYPEHFLSKSELMILFGFSMAISNIFIKLIPSNIDKFVNDYPADLLGIPLITVIRMGALILVLTKLNLKSKFSLFLVSVLFIVFIISLLFIIGPYNYKYNQ